MQAVTNGALRADLVRFSSKSSCCVVMASNGYPGKYKTGYAITLPKASEGEIYLAGAKLENGRLTTAGGRVLGAVAVADPVEDAVKNAYRLVDAIQFDNAYYRHDIGRRAIAAGKEN